MCFSFSPWIHFLCFTGPVSKRGHPTMATHFLVHTTPIQANSQTEYDSLKSSNHSLSRKHLLDSVVVREANELSCERLNCAHVGVRVKAMVVVLRKRRSVFMAG